MVVRMYTHTVDELLLLLVLLRHTRNPAPLLPPRVSPFSLPLLHVSRCNNNTMLF